MVALRGIRLGDMSYLILLCGSRLLAGPACISRRENPHIAAYWLYIRFEMFKREVLRKKWGIVDDWSRFEWQRRGSGHSHGLYWISNAPNPDVKAMRRIQMIHKRGGVRRDICSSYLAVLWTGRPDGSKP